MTYLKEGTFLQDGKYRIAQELGHGGFGVTYLAYQVNLDRRVAIKEFFMKEYCVRDESTSHVRVTTEHNRELVFRFRSKFVKEARCIANLSHPHIVRVIDVFEENGTAYYVMEYLGGGTLQDAVQAHGALSVPVASDYIRQVASALDYIHGRNLLHLDVKPSNIMLNDSGEAVLVDFGVSKRYDESGHQTSSTPLGVSEGYAPIEQYESGGMDQFSPSTDIYSLGATFYFLLTGSRPPKASALLSESLSFPDGVPEGIRACIVRSMAPGRKDRPQSVDEFLRLLETAVGGSGCKTVKDEETVLDDTVLEPEVLKPGKVPGSGKVCVSGRTSLRKWFVPVFICFFVGLGVYLFLGGKSDKLGSSEPVLSEDSLLWMFTPVDSIVSDTIELAEESSQTEVSSVSSDKSCINGHEYVDLGLPSGLKWATSNVGAYHSEDYGHYYAWGELRIKSKYTKTNSLTWGKNIGDISGDSRYDVARAKWGDSWRLPTKTEFEELLEVCTWTWTSIGSHKGYRVIGPNGSSIFFSAAGWSDDTSTKGKLGVYWTSTPYKSGTQDAYYLTFNINGCNLDWDYRYDGQSIRPVSE